MTAKQVHAVLAAGVEHPDLITHWQSEPQALRSHGLEPEAIDLAALRKFAGLTVKVRHNGLRADLPMTFRLMNVAGLEIEVFASYAAFRAEQGERFAATTEARTYDLIAFLEHWLDRGRREHVLLWDLIRHEWALARLARVSPPTPEPAAGTARPTGSAVPYVRGHIVLHEMVCDPRVVVDVLRQSNPALDQVPLQPQRFCYWRPEAASAVHILQLDEFGYYALSLVDGNRSVSALAQAMGCGRRPTRGFLQLLSELAGIEILAFHRRGSATAA